MFHRLLFLSATLLALAGTGRAQVAITEFLASNSKTLPDADGDFSDWIEIQNTGTATVNLLGWSLTDDPALTAKWKFPATNLNAGAFMVVFASGKNRTNAGAELHTSFSLSSSGEYLALFPPDSPTPTTEFAPQFPAQKPDISFGTRAGQLLFFNPPSPGLPNAGGYADYVADTKFSVNRGFFDGPFDLTISTATAGATLRYTTNGLAPTATTGILYSGPISIRGTTVLRAAAFKDGLQPSDVDTQTYLFLNDVIRQSTNGVAPPGWPTSWGGNIVNYGMDPRVVDSATYRDEIIPALKSIPSFCVVTDLKNLFDPSTGIYANPGQDGRDWERPCSLELMFPDGTKGFQVNAGIRIRGGFSRSTDNPKHAFRFFFRDAYGTAKLKYPLFDNNGTDEFDALDLRTFENYSWSFQGDGRGVFFRDQSSRDAQLAMGRQGERGKFYHLYINGQYWGLYNTCERPEAAYAATYYGGRKEDYDVIKVEAGPYTINATDGNMDAWTRLYTAAKAGLTNNAAYFKLEGRNADGTPNSAYENLLDIDNLIDYMLVILYGGNLDAPISNFLGNTSPNNWYGQRDRTGAHGGFRFNAHDSEHTLLSVSEDRTGPFGTATSWALNKSNPQYIWQQLSANAEFRIRVADRIQKHFFNGGVFTPQATRDRLSARTNEIYHAVVAESARWGDAKTSTPLTRNQNWLPTVNGILGSYVNQRTAIVISQLQARKLYPAVVAPTFAQFGGNVTNGFQVALSAPAGILFYTTDGSDPRLLGGAGSQSAKTYLNPFAINRTTTVRARVLSGSDWSALTEATFTIIQTYDTLLVTELMYHPPGTPDTDGDHFEFIELKNVGGTELDLSGVHFTNGVSYTFPAGRRLGPGQFAVLVSDHDAFTNRYPGVAVAGVYSGNLSNGGERLTLVHAVGTPIFDVTYNNAAPWPTAADGVGFSLVPANANANPDPNNSANWRASSVAGGSPGADDPAIDVPVVYINEVLAHTDPPQLDAVELYNPNSTPVNISSWFLTDDRSRPDKYLIPAAGIPAHGYLVIDESQFNFGGNFTNAFRLNSHGDGIWLYSADQGRNLTGFSDGFTFPASANGVSFGRYTNSVGEIQYPPQLTVTLGADNSGPRVGPVVLNEIQYQPLAGDVEFVELKNIASTNVPLFDVNFPTNTWRLAGADFSFPTNVTLPPGGLAVIADSDPALFRAHYGIPAAVPVFGPFGGNLQDSGERIELQRPDKPDPVTNELNQVSYFIPFVGVDSVRYNDKLPWPTNAAGLGASLERKVTTAYADDPANWTGNPGNVSPGFDSDVNHPPRVDAGPDQTFANAVAFPLVVSLAGSATDDGKPGGPLTYAWTQVDGPGPVSFATPTAATSQVRVPGQGFYTLRLTVNDGAATASDDVILTVTRATGDFVFVPAGATWRYLDNGSDQGTAWRAPAFNDSTWKAGPAQLGYGDGDEATLVDFGPDANAKYTTTYFRLTFNVADAKGVSALAAQLVRDDGALVWINGQLAIKDNMPDVANPDDITYLTTASNAVGGADESTFFEFPLDPALLHDGANTIAVEIHQSGGTSSDISFDFALSGKVQGSNHAPTVAAGADLAVTLPAAAVLSGGFTDDGLPNPPGVPQFAWSKLSGPGAVTFADAARPETTATFAAPGSYVLRLTANDGALSASDDVAVQVVSGEVPPSVSVVFTPGNPSLRFSTDAGVSYTVQGRADLIAGGWVNVQQVPAGAGGQVIEVPLGSDAGQKYYRVVSPAVP
ncbi:MAG TPA: lamin tail domain-containing protein [Candidatus Limnocylindria bacterium]|nr:lamin tail domain-containing protein [Candidatus Limnocylindria bacterium]